jgi:SAM-dependent methyltransferase
MAERVKRFFDDRDLAGLRQELSSNSKYAFVIREIEKLPSKNARILEVGCSRGYLTSYSILAGYDAIGVDISETALSAATRDFGLFFFLASSGAVGDKRPYDLIYHIGTIGCVSDPLRLTDWLLTLLKPGGKLIFNAPNREGCYQRGQLWIDFAPPPDVTALYMPGFWANSFPKIVYGSEDVERCSPGESFLIWLRRTFCKWRVPTATPLDQSLSRYKWGQIRGPNLAHKMWSHLERNALRIASSLRVLSLFPEQPTPFGIFVTLVKKIV